MSKANILDLNPQQKEAILYDGGPLLVLGGAGSGKTKVITHKLAFLTKKVSPEAVFSVTFTNRAADEMKERTAQLIKSDLKDAWVGTCQALCARILRKEADCLGYCSGFTIYDEDDQANLIRHILKEFKLYEALFKGVMAKISHLKSSLVSPEEFLSGCDFGFEERLARVYMRYQNELKKCNALDFDDLIACTVRLFEEHPKILKKYQKNFEYILVDEFQETNCVQYRLLKLLSQAHRNICLAGDDDQSINKYKGADINNIMNFKKDFHDIKIIRLEQSYRFTENILHVSEGLICKNTLRHDKKLSTDRGHGERVYHCWLNTEEDEAKHIAKVIRELYLKGFCDFRDMAILYRAAPQSRVLEETFNGERIPYRILGCAGFYQRKEIKDLLAYIRLTLNQDDNVSFRRILNCPPRGIGASTLAKMEQQSKKKAISLFSAIKGMLKSEGITSSLKEKLKGFINIIEALREEKCKDGAELLKTILAKTSYMDFMDEDKTKGILELIASASGSEAGEFVDRVSLITSLDQSNKDNAVSLMTLHNAKGFEFPVVFITGMEEGLVPYFKAATAEDLAEERRLLYVGMTRAKDILWLTGAGKRRLYTKIQEQEPSRFLKDIPVECCQKIEKVVKPHVVATVKARMIKKINPYVVGSRVKHPRWGVGVVRDFDGDGDEQKVTVNFPNIGIKRLALKFANLERL